MPKRILIIDDEENIQSSIGNILKSKNFTSVHCQSPVESLQLLEQNHFDLVLLDIWMPDMDGVQILRKIKSSYLNLPVVVISGHANISSNFEIARNGADGFIEKPFSAETLLFGINKALNINEKSNGKSRFRASRIARRIVKKGEMQKTVAKSTVIKGKGLHSGTSTGIIISPSPVDSGIKFEDIATGMHVEATEENVISTNYCTDLKSNNTTISVVEHLLAVFHIYDITNVSVKVNKEIPIIDGSAAAYCELIEKCGIKDQNKPKKNIVVDKIYQYVDPKDKSKFIRIEPYNGLYIDYTFELPGFGEQHYERDFSVDRIKRFKEEVAPARTFGFLEELKELQATGLARGGDLENFLLVDQNKVINQKLRYKDEFVRHKVLDILGDLMLLGCEIEGKITGRKTGHRHNIQLIRRIARG